MPWAYYCSKCYTKPHAKISIFHIGKVGNGRAITCIDSTTRFYLIFCSIKNGTFKAIDNGGRTIDVRLRDDCSSGAPIHLCCLDETGKYTARTIYKSMWSV